MATSRIKDQRKVQLIQATIDSIAKRGLTETTITHISKGANLSRGIVNFYFDSKEKMMRDVLAHLLDDYQQIWQQAKTKAGEGAKEQIEAIIRAHFDKRLCSPKRLNVMSAFWGHAASHDVYREQFDASDRAVQHCFIECWKMLKSETVPAEEFATQLHAMIRGLWLNYLMAPKQTDREALVKSCLKFVEQQRIGLKVVAENPAIKAARAAPMQPKPKKPAAPRRAANDGQMDIEDLFANG